MPSKTIDIPKDKIAAICRKHHIRRLSLFGSILRDDFGPDSDVDMLVEFEPGRIVGFRIFDIEEDLSQLFGGRNVHLLNRKYINHRLRDGILAEAEVQYEEG
ncbi:MAG: nucleotidyltransferase family protein [bacterium]